MAGKNEAVKTRGRGWKVAGLVLFFAVAFVALPLVKVAFAGGGNLYTRLGIWRANRISIQSVDPGRIAVADRESDIRVIADSLYPFETARERAEAYYDLWESNRHWSIFFEDLEKVELDADGKTARVLRRMKMRNEGDVYEYTIENTLRKIGGVWYVESETESRVGLEFLPLRSMLQPDAAVPLTPR